MFISTNPFSGATLGRYPLDTPQAVEDKLQQAAQAQQAWGQTPVQARCALLVRVAQVLRSNQARYAEMISLEMGKPLLEAEAEIEKSAWTCEFYAQAAPGYLADMPVASNAADSRVVFDPLGVVLAVMPGTILSGSSSALPPRRWPQAMRHCSSTPTMCRSARWPWPRSSRRPVPRRV